MQTPIDRIVIFIGIQQFESTIETIEHLVRSRPDTSFLILSGGLKISTHTRFRTKWRRFKNTPISTLIESVLAISTRLVPGGRGDTLSGTANPRLPNLSEIAPKRVRIVRYDRIHDPRAIKCVKEFSPVLGICVGSPVLRKSVFAIPVLGTINLHKSYLPDYKGMPSGFWELHDGAKRTGATVHWVDSGLDSGKLILQKPLEIARWATWKGVQIELDRIGRELLPEAVELVENGAAAGHPQGASAVGVRSQPPFLAKRRLRKQLWKARQRPQPLLRRIAKAVALTVFVHGYGAIRDMWESIQGNSRTVILLYHRVSDAYLDTVTVGIEQFDMQLALLKRHYEVISLEEFLTSRGRKRRHRQVVITFDDGYADNHLAAMLLRRRALPATFFICTQIVGTDRPFPHDVKRLGHTVPALTWDQTREMLEWNYSVGNHTSSHMDLGTDDLAAAEESIQEASRDLARELEPAKPSWLAYPYGRRDNMSEALRSRLDSLGVTHCLSAYGGSNSPMFDPFDIRRQGIDAHVDGLMLRALIEGWQIRS